MKFSDVFPQGGIFLLPEGGLRPIWRFLLSLPVIVGLAIVIALMISLLTIMFGPGSPDIRLLFAGILTIVSSIGGGWLLLRFVDRKSFRTFGLWLFSGWGRELAIGFALGAGLNTIIVVILIAAGWVSFESRGLSPLDAVTGLLWTLLVLSPQSAGEETLFRGYPFQRLVESWGGVGAILFTSFLFGWGHYNNPSSTLLAATNTGLAGALLAILYLKTRALWVPIGFHISWNYIMGAVYSLPVSGINMEQRLFNVEISGPDWLSGGGFGPEGSVLATAVLLAGCVWLARTEKIIISPEQLRELQLYPIVRVEGKEL